MLLKTSTRIYYVMSLVINTLKVINTFLFLLLYKLNVKFYLLLKLNNVMFKYTDR